jgi:hypothetical protein
VTSVMVFVQRSGVLVACRAFPEPDGYHWNCPLCDQTVMRASFGVLNGLTRCTCGADTELIVDGRTIEISALNVLEQQPVQESAPQPRGVVNDEDFLRECGIATQEEEEPC